MTRAARRTPPLLAALVPAVLLVTGCAGRAAPRPDGADAVWEAVRLWEGDTGIESVAIGDADGQPGAEVVGVDGRGRVVVANPALPGSGRAVLEHGARATGVLVADVDPVHPGAEIYVGAYARGTEGGLVLRVTLRDGRTESRTVHDAGAFVHTFARLPPATVGGTPDLVVGDYAGRITLLTPTPDGTPWRARVLYTEPRTEDPESQEVKQAVAGFPDAPRTVFVGVKSGSGLLVDADRSTVRRIHHEPGGIARAAIDRHGRLWLATSKGRALRLDPPPGGTHGSGDWSVTEVFRDTDGLRGVGIGDFTGDSVRGVPSTEDVAWFGYSRLCRVSRRGDGPGAVVYEDAAERGSKGGHWLAAADLLPGNGADEIVLASYTGRILLLRRALR